MASEPREAEGRPMDFVVVAEMTDGKRTAKQRGEYFDAEHAVYMWRDGNYCCDCNRRMFIDQELDGTDTDYPCSTGKVAVVLHDADGRELYRDELGRDD